MKHIILAAGKGTRMKHYTLNSAKGMLRVGGISILDRQVITINKTHPSKIIIIRGYRAEDIDIPDIKYYTNKDYDKTNMVASLMTAKYEFTDDITVSYGDILFNKKILEETANHKGDFVVAVDTRWKRYWKMRFDGDYTTDTESLKIRRGIITDIGKSGPFIEDIDARYIGVLKFSRKGLEIISDIYNSDPKWRSAYMTDLLQELIRRNHKVVPVRFKNGWVEIDTVEDYKKVCNWCRSGVIQKELNLVI